MAQRVQPGVLAQTSLASPLAFAGCASVASTQPLVSHAQCTCSSHVNAALSQCASSGLMAQNPLASLSCDLSMHRLFHQHHSRMVIGHLDSVNECIDDSNLCMLFGAECNSLQVMGQMLFVSLMLGPL